MSVLSIHPVSFDVADTRIEGEIAVPEGAAGLVIFAHGAGSTRQSPGNRFLAETLEEAGLAVLLFDLLTPEERAEEAETHQYRFDIPLLTARLRGALGWLDGQEEWNGLRLPLPIGLFGASTGGTAALWAAAERPGRVRAVVGRSARTDLALPILHQVKAPVLLLAGAWDQPLVQMNREAVERLPEARLETVEGATHLFPEPGALEQVAAKARDWFLQCLTR
ncbi:MAG: alpha/beta hydrolase [Verrucomicrobium sp.]|nr:alpha/beta hydrolase [Verrucomicrobium sp.]